MFLVVHHHANHYWNNTEVQSDVLRRTVHQEYSYQTYLLKVDKMMENANVLSFRRILKRMSALRRHSPSVIVIVTSCAVIMVTLL